MENQLYIKHPVGIPQGPECRPCPVGGGNGRGPRPPRRCGGGALGYPYPVLSVQEHHVIVDSDIVLMVLGQGIALSLIG